MRPVAHTPRAGSDEWDDLYRHLLCVAWMARTFAEAFGGGTVAFWAGLLHDVGKFFPAWQEYLWQAFLAELKGQPKPVSKTPHAKWGAVFAYRLWKAKQLCDWEEIALPIQGHHSGLQCAECASQDFINEFEAQSEAVVRYGRQALALCKNEPGSLRVPAKNLRSPTDRELFTRLVFSALVDADYLATEEHMRPDHAAVRGRRPELPKVAQRFVQSKFTKPEQTETVRRIRDEVYSACLAAAEQPQGFFRLSAATGTGKTRSSLAFALEHAKRWNLRRIVVALPYTSIIDQNAAEYRTWLGNDAVLEYHSALEPRENEWEEREIRLAAENWDAPVVVTTTVQLFESLFANRPSKVRKLHRLAGSVIILDEIQAFPTNLLRPAMDALRFLATPVAEGGAGCTVGFCTATQPAFDRGPLAELLPRGVREIVPNYQEHFHALRRVNYEVRQQPQTWAEIAEEIERQNQVLVVVNTRKDALDLLQLVEGDDVFHLSTLLCGAHRKRVLDEVSRRLRDDEPVKLISTQVVECGVDLDFPIGYRAIGPLDRIVQAAGRVNRNGLLGEDGRVVVFVPAEGRTPQGPYKTGAEKTALLFHTHAAGELHEPELHARYFDLLHRAVNLDKAQVQEARTVMDYPAVAERFRLIKDDTVSVVVEYGDWKAALEAWRRTPDREAWRRLRPYIVNVYQHDLHNLDGPLEPLVDDQLYHWSGTYDAVRHRGIVAIPTDPSDLYV